jgi:hypothetical protein
MSSENFTQVAPNSTGNKVRNRQQEVGQPDGSIATVQAQVIELGDRDRQTLESIEWLLKQQLAAIILTLQHSGAASPADVDELAGKL